MYKYVFIVIVFFCGQLAVAATVPVVDITEIAKTVEVINQLKKEYQQLQKQYNTLTKQYNALTGSSGIGKKFRLPKKFSDWTPSSQDLANMVKQGLATGSLADQLKYYNQKFPLAKPEKITPHNPNSLIANYQSFASENTNTSLGISDENFNRAKDYSKRISDLSEQIDKEDSLKKAMDLNSAAMMEVAYILNDLVRLQSQQLKMQAVQQQGENTSSDFRKEFIKDMK